MQIAAFRREGEPFRQWTFHWTRESAPATIPQSDKIDTTLSQRQERTPGSLSGMSARDEPPDGQVRGFRNPSVEAYRTR